MDNLRSERDKALVALRDLEMGNDELERNERSARRLSVVCVADIRSQCRRVLTARPGEQVQQSNRGEDVDGARGDTARRARRGMSALKGRSKRCATL